MSIIRQVVSKYGVPTTTARRHMEQGWCPWPRREHGASKHPLYKTWESMKLRCNNPNSKGYHNYGGRGIKVCVAWEISFFKFVEDMGPKPGSDYTLDRIDNDGNYEPSNCRWATPEEQSRNTRRGVGSVWKERGQQNWRAYVFGTHLGRFDTRLEAEAEVESWTALLKLG